MTPGDTKFSHITLHADDDDEFVIEAGVPSSQDNTSAPDAPAKDATPQAATAKSEPAEASVVEQAGEATSAHAADDYRQTTVEDLKTEPMSLTQKIVIAAAMVLIVAFIVYNLFMR